MDVYKAHGRRQAGTWAGPHRAKRVEANRATRRFYAQDIQSALLEYENDQKEQKQFELEMKEHRAK
jgi:hypothetical protein